MHRTTKKCAYNHEVYVVDSDCCFWCISAVRSATDGCMLLMNIMMIQVWMQNLIISNFTHAANCRRRVNATINLGSTNHPCVRPYASVRPSVHPSINPTTPGPACVKINSKRESIGMVLPMQSVQLLPVCVYMVYTYISASQLIALNSVLCCMVSCQCSGQCNRQWLLSAMHSYR